MKIWVYRKQFAVGASKGLVKFTVGFEGLLSELLLDGKVVATDSTPATGLEAIRNHRLAATLEDGRELEVEAGYNSWFTVGIAVRVDGRLVYESSPGRPIAYPESAARMVTAKTRDGQAAYDPSILTKNKIPIAVDVFAALLFFVVAKLTDLRTAALVGAAFGLGLIVVQRFVKVDLIGGMALFGVVMMMISTGFALAFADDEIIKQRSTIVGLIGALFFFVDALMGGKRLGKGLSRYIAYRDIDPRRLAFAMAASGAAMAILNFAVARLTTTDIWLFYTTFADIPVGFAMIYAAIRFARSGPAPQAAPSG